MTFVALYSSLCSSSNGYTILSEAIRSTRSSPVLDEAEPRIGSDIRSLDTVPSSIPLIRREDPSLSEDSEAPRQVEFSLGWEERYDWDAQMYLQILRRME